MSERNGFACDGCGKVGGTHTWVGVCLPDRWLKVIPMYQDQDYHFCSKACIGKWATGQALTEFPESKRVLFKKLLKAVFS